MGATGVIERWKVMFVVDACWWWPAMYDALPACVVRRGSVQREDWVEAGPALNDFVSLH